MSLVSKTINRCIICNESDWLIFQKVKRTNFQFVLRICVNCGFVAQNPYIGEKLLKNYYLDNYVEANYGSPIDIIHSESLIPAQARINYLNNNNLMSTLGKTLEIGPGAGGMIKLFSDYGIDISTVEPDVNSAIWLNKFIPKVYNGFFKDIWGQEETHWKQNPFECILMIHFLEHIKDPLEFLQNLHMILVRNGLLIIEIPNIKRPFSDEYRWETYCDPGHLHYFSQNSLTNLLNQARFEIILISDKIFEPYGNIFCVAKKVAGHGSLTFENLYDNAYEIIKIWNEYVKYHKLRLLRYKLMQKSKKYFQN
jgi:SAM-dependent methyltransferase